MRGTEPKAFLRIFMACAGWRTAVIAVMIAGFVSAQTCQYK